MSENTQPSENEQSVESLVISNTLLASEKQVVRRAKEMWDRFPERDDPKITSRSVAHLIIDSSELSHDTFAGAVFGIDRSFGPRKYIKGPGEGLSNSELPDVPARDESAIVADNTIQLTGVLLMKDQHNVQIITGEQAKKVAKDLRSVGLSGEAGYRFDVSDPEEIAVEDAPFEYELEFIISNIVDSNSRMLDGLTVKANLGHSDISSAEANLDNASDSLSKAEESLQAGALFSTPITLPRPNQIYFQIEDAAKKERPYELEIEQDIGEKLTAGLIIIRRGMEVALDKLTQATNTQDQAPNVIPLNIREPEDILYLNNTEAPPDLDWLSGLFGDF